MLTALLTPAILGTLVRHTITTLGGGLVATGYATNDDVTAIAGASATLVGLIWGMINKVRKR